MTQNEEDFKKVLNQTLEFEGGYTVDHAGPTNRGIRQDMYDSYAKQNKLPSKSVKDLKYGEVKDFYKKNYWENPKINLLPREISASVFDYGVNAGQGRAIMAVQSIVGAKPDGVIGPKTIKAINKYVETNGVDTLHKQILDNRVEHYNNLVKSDPNKYARYLSGWLTRVNKISNR